MNFASILDRSANRSPDKPALRYGDEVLTYREVDEAVTRFAAALVSLGVRPGDRVGNLIAPCPELAISFFAILRVGAVAVPVNVLYRPEEISHVIGDSGAAVLVTTEGLVPAVDAALPSMDGLGHVVVIGSDGADLDGARFVSYEQLISASSGAECPLVDRADDDLASFAYSSGTTGFPKAAVHTHYSLRRHGEMMMERYPLGPDDNILSVLPIFLLPSFMTGPALAFHTGATSVIRPKFDPVDFVTTVEQHGITLGFCTPTMYHMVVDLPEDLTPDLSGFRYPMFGGSPMPPALRRSFEERFGVRTYQTYGSAETVAVVVGDPVDRDRKFESVGTAMPGVEVRGAGDDGSWLGPGEIGEICVGPDDTGRYRTMVGYWADDEASTAALEGGFTHTGDVGYVDDDGFVFLVDRKKDVVFVGGWSVFPVEVEHALRDHPAVEFAAVVGIPDDRLGEIPKAYVQLRPGQSADETELIEYSKSRLASYKCPRQVAFVEEMPRNALGKILKRRLRDLGHESNDPAAQSPRGGAALKER